MRDEAIEYAVVLVATQMQRRGVMPHVVSQQRCDDHVVIEAKDRQVGVTSTIFRINALLPLDLLGLSAACRRDSDHPHGKVGSEAVSRYQGPIIICALISIVVAIVAGPLSYAPGSSAGEAVLYGGGALAAWVILCMAVLTSLGVL
ncbi:hypothetical protein ACIQ7D_07195 [Streptomyces sp. NPDC096310]|uniref:hypothetical protein n=1 Tax=Streptomyces sp. NPDC096310 TaxID=3366082 RepID=UPI0037FDABCF